MRVLQTILITLFLSGIVRMGFCDGDYHEFAPQSSQSMTTRWEVALSAGDLRTYNKSNNSQPGFKSLLIPGWAQLSVGRKIQGYIFLSIEAGLFAGLISQSIYSNRLEDSYQTYASEHAGIPTGKPHQYYVDIGNWDTVEEYNEQRLRYRQFADMYTDESEAWQWDESSSRLHFKDMRIRSDKASQSAQVIMGGLLLNHLLAFVDAGKGKVSVEQLGTTINGVSSFGMKVGFRFR